MAKIIFFLKRINSRKEHPEFYAYCVLNSEGELDTAWSYVIATRVSVFHRWLTTYKKKENFNEIIPCKTDNGTWGMRKPSAGTGTVHMHHNS
jgi:hypothetical protein